MRQLNDHKINPPNDALTITVEDPPGAGGASHRYVISGAEITRNAAFAGKYSADNAVIVFQNGPIDEHGLNGVTQEALLAIVIDRLRSFQSGEFACRENALALTKIEEAFHWLHARTRNRMVRGVEGRSLK